MACLRVDSRKLGADSYRETKLMSNYNNVRADSCEVRANSQADSETAWADSKSSKRHNRSFFDCWNEAQKQITVRSYEKQLVSSKIHYIQAREHSRKKKEKGLRFE